MSLRLIHLPLELVFRLTAALTSGVLAVWRFATGNFFIVFAAAVFVLYLVVFRLFGRH